MAEPAETQVPTRAEPSLPSSTPPTMSLPTQNPALQPSTPPQGRVLVASTPEDGEILEGTTAPPSPTLRDNNGGPSSDDGQMGVTTPLYGAVSTTCILM